MKIKQIKLIQKGQKASLVLEHHGKERVNTYSAWEGPKANTLAKENKIRKNTSLPKARNDSSLALEGCKEHDSG